MEVEDTLLWREFCDNIETESKFRYKRFQKIFTIELQYYIDTEKNDYVHSKRTEIIDKLRSSIYFYALTLERIEKDLKTGLKNIYDIYLLYLIREVKYDQTLDSREYLIDIENGIITVNSPPYAHTPFPRINFSFLNVFDEVVEHIALGMLLLVLNKMEQEYKNQKGFYQKQEVFPNFNLTGNQEVKIQDCRKKFSSKQIALIHALEGKAITKDNMSEYAANFGYSSKHSGHGLYQDYLIYMRPSDRVAEPTNCSKITLRNKIELFESVLPHLTLQTKQKAISEILVLKNRYEELYL